MQLPGEQLVIRMWETLIEKGIGSLLTPWQVGREGVARSQVRRHELLILAQAEVDARDISLGKKRLVADAGELRLAACEDDLGRLVNSNCSARIEPSLLPAQLAVRVAAIEEHEALRKQCNLSRALVFAEDALEEGGKSCSEDSIDDEWLFAWQEYASKVSAEVLQRLWGRALAGEVKCPGTFSIRTLEFLRGISKVEAERIARVARFVVNDRVFRFPEFLSKNGLTLDELGELENLGILAGVHTPALGVVATSTLTNKFWLVLTSYTRALLIEGESAAGRYRLEAMSVTTLGRQILTLGNFEPDNAYLRMVGQEFKKQGLSVKLCDLVDIGEGDIGFENPEEL